MRMKDIVNGRLVANRGCERSSVDSRQQKAARIRRVVMAQVNSKWGPELRGTRRSLMLAIARRERANV